jgi:hypothetical protein
MAKHELKQLSAARTTQPVKLVTVADRVEIGLSVLTSDERAEVKRAIRSWSRLRALSKTSDIIGTSGTLRIADISPNLCIVFRVTPREAEVVDLVNKRAFQNIQPSD